MVACRIYLELLEPGLDETVFEWAHGESPAPVAPTVAVGIVKALQALVDGMIRADAPLLFPHVQRSDSGVFLGVFPVVVGPAFLRRMMIWAQAEGENDSSEQRPQVPEPPNVSEKKSPPETPVLAGPVTDDADWWKANRN
jgi:hypothetical protein